MKEPSEAAPSLDRAVLRAACGRYVEQAMGEEVYLEVPRAERTTHSRWSCWRPIKLASCVYCGGDIELVSPFELTDHDAGCPMLPL